MKKILFGLMALMVSVTMLADSRTAEEAAEIAASFVNSQPALRRAHRAPQQASQMRLAHTRVKNASQDNAFYVFNRADNAGFVIVSADDRTSEDVLGYSDKGSFSMETANPNMRFWLERYTEEISAINEEYEIQAQPRKAVMVTAISPLLVNQNGKEITWYQTTPYNNLCPMDQLDNTRCYTGCVATAAAQVMYKWRWPNKGTGSSSYTWEDCTQFDNSKNCTSSVNVSLSANYGTTTYDWDNMLPAYMGKSYTNAQANAVATLMYHCGVSCEMMYGGDEAEGSGAWTDYMAYALKSYFGYELDRFITTYSHYTYGDAHSGVTANYSVSVSQFTTYFNADLEAGRPIIMGGSSNASGGHEFVCDGRDASGKFHINWGWEGDCNGYFALTALKPEADYDFSSSLDAIIGLRPAASGHTVEVNGTGCTIVPSAIAVENGHALTATITPTDATYDFTSLTVKLGSTTLTQGTHYTLSADKKNLTVLASAITGDNSNNLVITAVWTKNRYQYELLGEHCTVPADGMVALNAELNLTITADAGYTLADAVCWDVEMGSTTLTYGTGFTYDATTGAFRIASVTGDVAILAYGSKVITWMAHGDPFETTIAVSDKLTLPVQEPDACDGKVFAGWTAIADYEHGSIAPAMVEDGDNADATTYYAVYATPGEGGTSVADAIDNATTGVGSASTYTAWSGKTGNSGAVYAGQSAGSNSTIQLRSNNENSGIITTTSGGKISKVTVDWYSGTTTGRVLNVYGKNSAYAAADDLYDASTSGTLIGTIVYGTSTELSISDEYTYIGVRSASGALYMNSITFTWGGGYSGYSTTCVDEPVVHDPVQVRFLVNGTVISTQTVDYGSTPDVPAAPTACGDYSFAGWWTAELAEDNTEAKSWISNFKAYKAQDYYAVFSKTEESQTTQQSTTYTFTSKSWADSQNAWNSTKEGNQLTSGQGVQVTTGVSGAGAETKAAQANVSKVVVNYCTNSSKGAGSIAITVGSTEVSQDVTKTGGTTLRDLEFDFNNANGKVSIVVTCSTNSIYVNAVTIISGGGTTGTTYYSTVLSCDPSGISDIETPAEAARKMLRDGQLLIVRDGKTYTIQGIIVE